MTQSCSNPGCTANSTKRCVRCRESSYCSKLCQKENWPTHKLSCAAAATPESNEVVHCVKLYSHGEGRGRYEDVSLARSHPIFDVAPLPISLKFGFPLVMTRLQENLPRERETDNQHATWLNIDPVSGFAPDPWQGSIGSVYVARANRSPLTTVTLAAVTDYVSLILDYFGERNPASIPRIFYSWDRLEKFFVPNRVPQQDYRASLPSSQS